ncbi:MAG: PEGA domain-containing protein [Deltaproteobacteria bacterium]|nr:PEGA domain-containing protein [Deltaproteobacteria bacterium]
MTLRQLRLAILAAVTATGSGCATVMHGTQQEILVTTQPPGATVTVLPGGQTLQTPGTVRLARKDFHTVRVSQAGYCAETVYLDRVTSKAVYGNLVLVVVLVPAGLVAASVDADNGAAFFIRPDELSLTLRPIPAAGADACGELPVCQ